jgi:hypothetical protein
MIYRKRGSTVRWENGTLISVNETGVAIEEGDVFTCHPERSAGRSFAVSAAQDDTLRAAPCHPERSEGPSSVQPGRSFTVSAAQDDTLRVAHEIQAIARDVTIERLIVTSGVAEHECDGRTWSERSQRIHLSLAHRGLRTLIDLATFDTSGIADIANALARCVTTTRETPPRLRLAPPVTAALLPSLVGLAPPNVELWQTGGGLDGNGKAIIEQRIDAPPYPNVYRPTYRMRPLRTPLDLQLRCAVTAIDEERPRAIALLAPADGLTLHVLIVDGRRVYPAAVRIARIDAVAPPVAWYPYGAGSFGAEMML